MSSNRALLILSIAAAAVALAACGTTSAGGAAPLARLPTEQYPLTVDEAPAELLLAAHETGLSENQRAALADYGRRWRANSTTEVVIEAPSQGGAGAYNTSHAAADFLSGQGVPVRIVGSYAEPNAPIRLSFLAGAIVTPSDPIFTVPSQVTAHWSFGSTMGRHAVPSRPVSAPLAGSTRNECAETSAGSAPVSIGRLPTSRLPAHEANTLRWSEVTMRAAGSPTRHAHAAAPR